MSVGGSRAGMGKGGRVECRGCRECSGAGPPHRRDPPSFPEGATPSLDPTHSSLRLTPQVNPSPPPLADAILLLPHPLQIALFAARAPVLLARALARERDSEFSC